MKIEIQYRIANEKRKDFLKNFKNSRPEETATSNAIKLLKRQKADCNTNIVS
jgi:hypothetical protein